MFEQALSADTKSNLAAIGQTPLARQFYLAGGSAVALHLGHRFSNDLDFFSQERFNIDIVLLTLKSMGRVEVFQAKADTFNGLLNDFRISFFIYPYPILEPFREYAGAQIASLEDLAAMKIDAISRRGTKRDFIDLYVICQRQMSLDLALDLYFQKFVDYKISLVHVLKSLFYFSDADQDEMPNMIDPISWLEIKSFFEREGHVLYHSKLL